MQTLQTEKLAV